MLEERRFTLFTDHKLLTYALVKVAEPWTACQCRHLSYVVEFSSDILHIRGTDNVVGDMLSRPLPLAIVAVAATPETLDYTDLAGMQWTCPCIKAAKDSNLALKLICFGEFRILCDTSMPQPRLVIPLYHLWKTFAIFHNMAQNININAWVKDCQACPRSPDSPPLPSS